MNLVDLVTIASFAGVIVLGVMYLTVQDLRSKRPTARIHARMGDVFSFQRQRAVSTDDAANAELFNVTKKENAFSRWFGPKIARLRTVAGASGLRIVIAAAIVGELVAVLMARFMPLPAFAPPLLLVGLPLFVGMRAYGFLVERFRRRFLDGFPDLIDLLVRAVRAGVPVAHMIGAAAEEVQEPLRRAIRFRSGWISSQSSPPRCVASKLPTFHSSACACYCSGKRAANLARRSKTSPPSFVHVARSA
jgi:tight adherence protein B